jgi:hypothetical protein
VACRVSRSGVIDLIVEYAKDIQRISFDEGLLIKAYN